ncbi:MAG: hypothetical protein HOU81_01400 [Hamadaea sp.]|uniref:hypothetical protein n=1 Tax=Hamadaea sp. TaxID=2024425 RepID=UPI0017A9AE3A|nr:hypothetical protein [Hamadaea sp.]NUR69454.1 hypothetical protein [Hamadaea sp.]NUT23383.1 hypothetical protein [Hamadaea sp.]
MTPWWIIPAFLVALPALAAAYHAYGPISRSRLTAFARWHELPITTANGNQVIRYLAVTRRWRSAGLITGWAVAFAVELPQGRVSFNPLVLFAGWFAGALAAEIHLAIVVHGRRRTASLVPRTPKRYVSAVVWGLLPVGALAGIAVLPGAVAEGTLTAATVSWTALALAIVLVVALVRRKVLLRAQPVEPADVIRADDAIRSRSLHVLSGGGFALAAYCALAALATRGTTEAGVAAVAGLAVLAVGITAARSRRPAPRPAA